MSTATSTSRRSRPSIERLGFETCGSPAKPLPTFCDPEGYLRDGGCIPRFTCQADQDCAGLVSPSRTVVSKLGTANEVFELVPYCVDGSCSSCPNAYCPGALCFSDKYQCTPPFEDGGLTCNLGYLQCGCIDDAACGGFWPVCEGLDSGFANGMGQAAGLCGCDRDDQCGDGGLSCVQPLGSNGSYLIGYCGVACGDPQLPACVVFSGDRTPVCDGYAHVCRSCGSGSECRNQTGGQTGSFCRPDGTCGCKVSSDCPPAQACQAPYETASDHARLGFCAPPPPQCTPASCNGTLCDPDGGCETEVACATDYDCSIGGRELDPFCDSDAGVCRQCGDDTDCLKAGLGAELTACGASFSCTSQCATDMDCVGNPLGSVCLTSNGNVCGCGSDRECAGNPAGPHCDTTSQDGYLGLCLCRDSSECAAGSLCQVYSSTASQCGDACETNGDCAPGFYCNGSHSCRPRCDPGRSCTAPDPVCDVDNIAGHNDAPANAVWCYECLTAADCDAGLGCLTSDNYSCGACGTDLDCRPGEVCLGGVCVSHPGCDAGGCSPGQVCDTLGLAGRGADICYQCLGPIDCPDDLGCNGATHTCGTCQGPTANGGPFDCPPGAICSNYWADDQRSGVCLQNCDVEACPPGLTCDWFPSLTPDHKYCFGCLRDLDCAAEGSGAWCDTSVNLTFSCRPAPP